MSAIDKEDKVRMNEHVERIGREMGLTSATGTMSRSRLFKVSWETESYLFDGMRKERLKLSIPSYMKWAGDEALDELIRIAIVRAYTVDGEVCIIDEPEELNHDDLDSYINSDEFVFQARKVYLGNSRTLTEEVDEDGVLHKSYERLQKAKLIPDIRLPMAFCINSIKQNSPRSQTHIMAKIVEMPITFLENGCQDNTIDWLVFNQVILMEDDFDMFDRKHEEVKKTKRHVFPQKRKDMAIKDIQSKGLWQYWVRDLI